MNTLISLMRSGSLIFASALLFCISCKQKEQPSAPPTPLPAATNETAAVITPEDARNHVGETATVRGKVDRVYVSQKGDVFIDIGGKHPNAPFTAICFKQAIPTAQLQTFSGKVVSVKGTNKEYNGKAEIVLQTADQISE